MLNTIVPQDVLDHYLSHYNAGQRAEIERVYRELRAAMLNAHNFTADEERKLLMTAGASGAGKSTHLRSKVDLIAQNGGTQYVRLDIDDMIGHFPSFQTHTQHLRDYFGECVSGHCDGGDLHGRALRDATNEWIFAAKYVADRLLNDCAFIGIPVAFETSAHNDHIDNFFARARALGYRIELDLCDAPLAAKQKASLGRFDRGEAYVDPASITSKHADVVHNLHTYARSVDKLNLLWRDHAGANLTLVATSDATGAYMLNEVAAADFDAAYKTGGFGTTVGTILQLHSHHGPHRRNGDGVTRLVMTAN